jgi:hypothetical protein
LLAAVIYSIYNPFMAMVIHRGIQAPTTKSEITRHQHHGQHDPISGSLYEHQRKYASRGGRKNKDPKETQ